MSGEDGETYLIAGATGVIGRRLAAALLADGVRVRALVRDRDRGRRILGPAVELFEADLEGAPDLAPAMEGVAVAYFLVHMLGSPDYAQRERAAAEAFAKAAAAAAVGRIVYLGGLGPDHGGSPHLESRHATAEYLGSTGIPVTYFRAAAVIGGGSESFRTLYYLVKNLPVMVTPKWVNNRTQPIAIDDVIEFLCQAPKKRKARGRQIDIGGPQIMTYAGMMDCLATVMGRRRRLKLPVPVLTPQLSSHWIGFVTPVDPGVAKPIVQGLAVETFVRDGSGMSLFDVDLTPIPEAMRKALEEAGDELD